MSRACAAASSAGVNQTASTNAPHSMIFELNFQADLLEHSLQRFGNLPILVVPALGDVDHEGPVEREVRPLRASLFAAAGS